MVQKMVEVAKQKGRVVAYVKSPKDAARRSDPSWWYEHEGLQRSKHGGETQRDVGKSVEMTDAQSKSRKGSERCVEQWSLCVVREGMFVGVGPMSGGRGGR
jgi:hypothetical protein